MVDLVVAGDQAEAHVSGDWRLLHVYLPAALVPAAATDLGLSFERAAAVRLTGLDLARDPVLATVGFALARRLERGDTPQHLELDELGVSLAEYLVLRCSNVSAPQKPQPRLGSEEFEVLAGIVDDLELDPLSLVELFDRVVLASGWDSETIDLGNLPQIAGPGSKRGRLT
jgi:hypothetical protein